MDAGEGDFRAQTAPEDENGLEDKKKDRKLNLSFDIIDEFQSIINPPREEARGHCKRRGDRPEKEEVETHGLESGDLEEEIKEHEERRAH